VDGVKVASINMMQFTRITKNSINDNIRFALGDLLAPTNGSSIINANGRRGVDILSFIDCLLRELHRIGYSCGQ
jgi:hypothetical protein